MRKLFSEGDDVLVRDYIEDKGRKIYIESAHIYQDELLGDKELSCSCFDCTEKDADGISKFDADFNIPVSILVYNNPEYCDGKEVIEFDGKVDENTPNGWLWLNHIEGKFETLPDNDYMSLQLYMPEHLTFNELPDRRTVLPVEAVNTKNGLDTSVFVLPEIQIPLSEIKESGKSFADFISDTVIKETGKYFPVTTYLCTDAITPNLVTDMVEVGDWRISDNNFKKYSMPVDTKASDKEESFGSVYYGNCIYDIHSWESGNASGPCLDVQVSTPVHCYSDIEKHEFIFDKNYLDDLKASSFKCTAGSWNIERTQENCQSINELKKDIVQQLLNHKLIKPRRTAIYIDMKENQSGFPWQYEKAVDVIKFLEQQRNELPIDLINKPKLNNNDYETLKTHYDKIYDYLKEKPVNKDNILYREMVMNGLPDNRIKYVHNFGFARERMRSLGGDLTTVDMLKKLSKMRPSIEKAMRFREKAKNAKHLIGQ